LAGESQGIYRGRVRVAPDAQKIDASQLSKSLLLSDKAEAYSRPELEIDADDVKCAHGATVGQLNPEEVFYLESRGIPHDKARAILMQGFADLSQEIPLEMIVLFVFSPR
jgi:Fe-S cluster assembly protein SufD